MNEAHNIDCMEYMKTVPDKYFDLAVVDAPYGGGLTEGGGCKGWFSKYHQAGEQPDEKSRFGGRFDRYKQSEVDENGKTRKKPILWDVAPPPARSLRPASRAALAGRGFRGAGGTGRGAGSLVRPRGPTGRCGPRFLGVPLRALCAARLRTGAPLPLSLAGVVVARGRVPPASVARLIRPACCAAAAGRNRSMLRLFSRAEPGKLRI